MPLYPQQNVDKLMLFCPAQPALSHGALDSTFYVLSGTAPYFFLMNFYAKSFAVSMTGLIVLMVFLDKTRCVKIRVC